MAAELPKTEEAYLHRVFLISIFVKAVDGLLEVFGGFLFLIFGPIVAFATRMINGELAEDPTDFVANHLQHLLPYFSAHAAIFAAVYLLSHGAIKLFLVGGLFMKKRWAYPLTIIVLGLFIAYQLIRFSYTHSIFLIVLTFFDALIIILTSHEYSRMKKRSR